MTKTYTTNIMVLIDQDIIKGAELKFSSIIFINTAPTVGGADVIVNGALIPVGSSLQISDETGATDDTTYNIKFVAGGINRLLVLTRIYKS
jgi:hypothetical protein